MWGEADDAAWEGVLSGAPASELATPFPNPTSGQTSVVSAVEAATAVRLAVYDALGREVAVLAEGPVEVGAHRATLDGATLPPGVYLVRPTAADGQTAVQRLTVARCPPVRLGGSLAGVAEAGGHDRWDGTSRGRRR
ncbi:T9SS type A sorting domain-containing protein [Rubrivirga marina]|uniref:Secretion system C-terminal sorting domain-containing protein n=1 Tax=Rubrivirga marina TaxID=1196024 RepID=A0A271IXH3_9BACT|nr:T9SS type A sorting domain-containing protein [Rubrivirga marina]PAP75415.1 hypothetical protein BSZ37_02630 [Rubrivirga marina]